MITFTTPITTLYSVEDIAELTGLEPISVRRRADQRGVGTYIDLRTRVFTEEDVNKLREKPAHHYTTAEDTVIIESAVNTHPTVPTPEIADKLGRSPDGISRRLRRLGYRWNRNYLYWEKIYVDNTTHNHGRAGDVYSVSL